MSQSVSYNLEDVPKMAQKIVAEIDAPVILFLGEMGAGKTTLIKAVCAALNVEDEVSSPTFSLVNEYQSRSGKPIFHFDFYRIEDETEALDFGVEEYLESGEICLLEWPQNIANLLPEKCGVVKIEWAENDRKISFFPKISSSEIINQFL